MNQWTTRTARREHDQRGFTLIELLVVIVVLGVLSALVVFAVRGSGDKGRDAAIRTDERIVRTALETYCAKHGSYPKAIPPKDAMQVLVDEKFLSDRSTYHVLATGGTELDPREGNCQNEPKHYSLTPVDDPSTPVTALPGVIATGGAHSLALKPDGTVLAWGENSGGKLGTGQSKEISRVPLPVIGLSGVIAIAAGGGYSVALKSDGTVWTWGSNNHGSLGRDTGDGSTSSSPGQVSGLSGVTAIEAGMWHALAIMNGEVWAWGLNTSGQLGATTGQIDLGGGLEAGSATPVRAGGANLSGVTAISANDKNSMAIKNGEVWTWGGNQWGQLGNGTTSDDPNPTPAAVAGVSGVTAISAGGGHSLALTDGEVWAWGLNDQGQLGRGSSGSTLNSTTPVMVSDLSGVTAIAAGVAHSMALKGGTVWAWGSNFFGQLGNGTTSNQPNPTPAEVVALNGVTAIASKWAHSLALKGDGTLWAWGDNFSGQCGPAAIGDTARGPVLVPTV